MRVKSRVGEILRRRFLPNSADESAGGQTAKKLTPFFLTFFVLIFVIRFAVATTVGLGDDEAYYWDWSRHLSLSYFDHPGMVAWLIKAGTLLFGDTPLGVRFFGWLLELGSAILVYQLARDLFDRRTGQLATCMYLLAPGFGLGAIMMVPDVPMGFFWILVVRLVWMLSSEKSPDLTTWIAAGFALGFGLLSKYTILLLAVSVVLFFLCPREREMRKRALSIGFALAVVISAALCLPIIAWNIQYDWPTLAFHLRERQTHGAGINFTRWLQFLISQLLILTPFLFTGFIVILKNFWRNRADRRWRLIVILSLPTILVFTYQALMAEFKPHWPMPGYILLFIGLASWLDGAFQARASVSYRRQAQALISGALIFSLPLLMIFEISCYTPLLGKIIRSVSPSLREKWDPKMDPTNDFYGWNTAAKAAEELRAQVVADNARGSQHKVFLASHCYQTTAQLAFATRDFVLRTTLRQDAYNFFQPLAMRERLKDQDAIFVTDGRFDRDPRRDRLFSSCTEQEVVKAFRGAEVAHVFHLWVCRDYKGIVGIPEGS